MAKGIHAKITTTVSQLKPKPHSLPRLLATGGDMRIICDPKRGTNKYGCSLVPDPQVLAYGSSTASTISTAGFAAAEHLYDQLLKASRLEDPSITYTRELDRIRHELIELCGLTKLSGLEIVFGASGTDLHLFMAQLAGRGSDLPLLVIMTEASETGAGVPAALGGQHFSGCTALGVEVIANTAVEGGCAIKVAVVQSRATDGSGRRMTTIDAEIEALVTRAVTSGQPVLLVLTDVSKTGIIAPRPSCALALRDRFPTRVEVLVDACQFRFAPSTLGEYLKHDLPVAITGSKFITGPAFCGALLMPEGAARRLRHRRLAPGLRAYSACADWPKGWAAQALLANAANYGLLLRWEAALVELRAFRSLPETKIRAFLESFSKVVTRRLSTDPAFEYPSAPELDRRKIMKSRNWDHIPTIFPFLVRNPGSGRFLRPEETTKIYKLLGRDLSGHPEVSPKAHSVSLAAQRCQIGQPAPCGFRNGVPVSFLRLCLSSRLILDALSRQGRGASAVIQEALTVLDKAAMLAALASA